ncbi:hypothetical protein [Ketogulonicigenium vulgare]|uniref:hypothetical protein n=1 Tax=Ketogulonicigenium vulgare TaxID=92945 RepID=UPI0013920A50|nr:hypothetical protein [Ketogulonicigenium vulgare]
MAETIPVSRKYTCPPMARLTNFISPQGPQAEAAFFLDAGRKVKDHKNNSSELSY